MHRLRHRSAGRGGCGGRDVGRRRRDTGRRRRRMTGDAPSAVDRETFLRLVRETMTDVAKMRIDVEELVRGRARVRLGFDAGQLRPGGTISGPTIFTVADLALYAATLSVIG